jgi:hypothetical protein
MSVTREPCCYRDRKNRTTSESGIVSCGVGLAPLAGSTNWRKSMITSPNPCRAVSSGSTSRVLSGRFLPAKATFLTVHEVEMTKTLGSMGASVKGGVWSGQIRNIATVRRATFHLAAGWKLSNGLYQRHRKLVLRRRISRGPASMFARHLPLLRNSCLQLRFGQYQLPTNSNL